MLIEHNLAVNDQLPTHVDTENDSLHQVLNTLTRLEGDSRRRFIDLVYLPVRSIKNSNLGKILKDSAMANVLLDLFRYIPFGEQHQGWTEHAGGDELVPGGQRGKSRFSLCLFRYTSLKRYRR